MPPIVTDEMVAATPPPPRPTTMYRLPQVSAPKLWLEKVNVEASTESTALVTYARLKLTSVQPLQKPIRQLPAPKLARAGDAANAKAHKIERKRLIIRARIVCIEYRYIENFTKPIVVVTRIVSITMNAADNPILFGVVGHCQGRTHSRDARC